MSKIYAHRGVSSLFPENTMEAFLYANKIKCDGIELDVHLSKDGEVVVIHDHTLDRTTNLVGAVSNHTYKEIEKGKISYKDNYLKVPLLRDVFKAFKNLDTHINIELKASGYIYKDIEKKVADLIVEYNYINKAVVSSFDHRALVNIKNINPYIKTAALFSSYILNPVEYIKKYNIDFLNYNYLYTSDELIKELKDNNISMSVYTVDEKNIFTNLKNKGVDIIITNTPQNFIK